MGAIVIILFLAFMPSLITYAAARSFAGLIGVALFCFAFARLAYKKNLRLSRLTVSVTISYLPAIVLNLLTDALITMKQIYYRSLNRFSERKSPYFKRLELYGCLITFAH